MAFSEGTYPADDTYAPTDFQVSSSSSGSSEACQFEIRCEDREKCPVCWSLQKEFICKTCVRKGNFWGISSAGEPSRVYRERFVDTKKRLLEKKLERDCIKSKCMELTVLKERALTLVEEIQTYEMRMELQKELKQKIESKLMQAAKEFGEIKRDVEIKTRNSPVCRRRLKKMEQQRNDNYAKLELCKENLDEKKLRLQNASRNRILQLREYVFPIQEMYADSKECRILSERMQASNVTLRSGMDGWSDEEDDTVRSLMAATSGRVNVSSSDFCSSTTLFHSIAGEIGPALPASGDYSARYLWDGGQSSASTRTPSQIISAGLTFLTQLVNMISYYLDLRLPHRLSYSEFSLGCLSDKKFNRKVAKLNANVVHLCTSQGVPASYLQPRKTVANLLLLFDSNLNDHCKLGRRGPFEVAIQLAKSMEDSMEKDLVIYEDDSSESDNEINDYNFPSDWETVHRGSITEEMSQLQTMTRYNSYIQSGIESDFSRSRNSASIAGTLVSSVTSFFRGWNN